MEDLQAHVDGWQASHDARVQLLDHYMSDIEASVANAEESARFASLQMAELSGNLVERLEKVEQRREMELLVRQGRIPADNLD